MSGTHLDQDGSATQDTESRRQFLKRVWGPPVLAIGGTATVLSPVFAYGFYEHKKMRSLFESGEQISGLSKVYQNGYEPTWVENVTISALSEDSEIVKSVRNNIITLTEGIVWFRSPRPQDKRDYDEASPERPITIEVFDIKPADLEGVEKEME